MEIAIKKLIQEAIDIENNMAKIYEYFYNEYDEDKDFWWQLHIEEQNHASLIKSSFQFLEMGVFDFQLVKFNLEELKEFNYKISEHLKLLKEKKHTKKEAYTIAYQLENTAYEHHYQLLMKKESHSKILQVFQKLNNDDLDHGRRIKNF